MTVMAMKKMGIRQCIFSISLFESMSIDFLFTEHTTNFIICKHGRVQEDRDV